MDLVFKALADSSRRRLLDRLHRSDGKTLSELCDGLQMTRQAVSKHLRVLSNAGLIEHRSIGTRNLYVLAPGGMAVAQQWLVRTWDTVLAAYAADVSRASQQAAQQQSSPKHP